MTASGQPGRVIRFGAFELDPEAGELRKSGIRLKVAEQPLRILIRLLDKPGEIVSRDELRDLLWGNDTFVDFEHGLNAAANRLRETLGDSAANPRYIETVPRRGYRFIGEVQRPVSAPLASDDSGSQGEFLATAPRFGGRPWKWAWLAVSVLFLIGAGVTWWWTQRGGRSAGDWEAHPLTEDDGLTTMPALSPDGKWVAYASDRASGKDLDIWVQPLARNAEPVRLTRHPADDEWPSFSPDGTWIAFSSARDGGGIYLLPTLGGSERLLARGCVAPRFSPDSRWVVCTAGGHPLFPSQVLAIPVGGGPARQLAPNLGWADTPVFSPDGRLVLIRGADKANSIEPHRLWLAPLDGGPAIPTEILAELEKQGVQFERAGEWLEKRILFEGGGHLWEIEFNARERRVAGPARPLIRGAANQVNLRATRSGGVTRIVFRVANYWRHLWMLKLEVNQGKALGKMKALEHSGGSQSLPTTSADGRRLVYLQTQPGGAQLRLLDLRTHAEQVLLSTADYTRPKLSPDGKSLAYHLSGDGIYIMASAGGAATKLLGFPSQTILPGTFPAAQIYGWTPDSRQIVYWHGQPIRFSLLEVSTGISRPLISHPHRDIHGAELAPDQRWLAFHTPSGSRGPLWIAPVRQGQAGEESEWVKVFDAGVENCRPWWSPDGNLLYFVSLLDGFPCIYAQRLDPGNKHPLGEPRPVYHFHSARVHPDFRHLAFFGPAVLPDGIIFSLVHEMGNVWYAESSEDLRIVQPGASRRAEALRIGPYRAARASTVASRRASTFCRIRRDSAALKPSRPS